VTWREIGYNFCFHRPDYAELGSLPDWARKTLDEHRSDERPEVYGLADFEEAATHDQIWNAAQNELRARGRIHNYLRMLWGKKILHWSRTPEEALDIMIELNNKRDLLGSRALRPSLGSRAGGVRQGSVYELEEHSPQAKARFVPEALDEKQTLATLMRRR
jgi:hypothetical protein